MRMLLAMYRHKSASLILHFAKGKKHVRLSDFHARQPRKGHGSKLLTDVLEYCDDLGATVFLEVVSEDRKVMSNSKLVKFYERFGFVKIGPGKPIMMKRKPKK